jgi:hypothetical protein
MNITSNCPVHAGKEVEETLRVVDAQTKEAAGKKEVVEGEEGIASEKAAAAKAIKVSVGMCQFGVLHTPPACSWHTQLCTTPLLL